MLVGLGGVAAEALADVAIAPAPLSIGEAGALAGELSGRALLDGFRGGPVADRAALGAVLAALGDLLVHHREIEDVEINPLRVTADGLLALDAVLTMEGQGGPLLTRRTITPVAEGVTPWPEELARAYTERGWWRGRALGAELLAAADANPGAVALVDGDIRLTYRSLAARADALASRRVDALGLVREDRIVVQLPNCWQFVVLALGCLRAGIVPVMALPATASRS